jgi:hypothetical protein
MSSRLFSHTISLLWLALNSNGFFIFILAVLSWVLVSLVGYGGWIVGGWIVQLLEDALRVVLQIH